MTDQAVLSNNDGKTLKIKHVGVFLGAEVTSVDLSQPLTTEQIHAVKQAHADHGVLVFPNQLSPRRT